MSVLVLCVFCDSFHCSISLLLLSDFLSCILNSVRTIRVYVIVHDIAHNYFRGGTLPYITDKYGKSY